MKFYRYGIVSLILVSFMACSKPSAPQGQGSTAPKTEVTPDVTPPPVTNSTPFVIPPAAKKQAKYFPEGTPTRAIQDLDDTLDSYVTAPKTPEENQYNEKLKKSVLHGTVDIQELCRLALDKHWKDRTPQEQTSFVDLMTRLLEKKAIFSKEQGQKKRKSKNVYSVTYVGDKFLDSEKTRSLVTTQVNIPSENLKIELKYKMKKVDKTSGSEWMVYDIIVDEASLVDNYKYQFDKIIEKEGYPNLIHRMESKLQDMDKKQATPQ